MYSTGPEEMSIKILFSYIFSHVYSENTEGPGIP